MIDGAADVAGFVGYDHLDIITTEYGHAPLDRVIARLQYLLTVVPSQPRKLIVASGNQQTGQPGTRLAAPVRFVLTDIRSVAVGHINVHVVVESGGGTIDGKTSEDLSTDTTGAIAVQWTLGPNSSAQTLTATLPTSPSLTSTATANGNAPPTPGPANVLLPTIAVAGHSCFLTGGTTAYCFGDGTAGDLGNGSAIGSSSPVSVAGGLSFATVGVGYDHTCGLSADSTVYCWGGNDEGQLGSGAGAAISVPVVVSGAPKMIALNIGGAASHTCGLDGNGIAYCWGFNRAGQAGNGVQTETAPPKPVATSLTFTKLAVGSAYTCAVATTGATYCWGDDEYDQLGVATPPVSNWTGTGCVYTAGPFSCALTPLQVATNQHFVTLAAGEAHTCALTASGAAYCWGTTRGTYVGDTFGLGDGTLTNSPTPIPVAQGLAFVSLAAGNQYTCGLTIAGAAYCWGDNRQGQLGDGTQSTRLSPVAVAGGHVFSEIAAGQRTTCGRLRSDGSVYCWGDAGSGVNNLTPIVVQNSTYTASGSLQIPRARLRR